MASDIRKFIEHCIPCQRFKPGSNRKGELYPIRALAPFHMVGVDVKGPLNVTASCNRYVVSFMDYYTKWPEGFAVSDQKTSTVLKLLCQKIIPQHGAHRIIISDNGPCFKANRLKKECEKLGIRLSRATPYHHQANGLIERWHRIIQGMVRPLTEEHQEDRDEVLDCCLFAYRTSIHPSTGNTPYLLMHGRDPIIPGEAQYASADDGITPADYAARVSDTLRNAWLRAAEQSMEYQQRYKHIWDKKSKYRSFKPGDCILLRCRIKMDNRISEQISP